MAICWDALPTTLAQSLSLKDGRKWHRLAFEEWAPEMESFVDSQGLKGKLWRTSEVIQSSENPPTTTANETVCLSCKQWFKKIQ